MKTENMSKQIDGQKMRDLAELIKKQIPGLGFALITFEFGNPDSMANYISNAQREDMVNSLQEVLDRWKSRTDFLTPNNN